MVRVSLVVVLASLMVLARESTTTRPAVEAPVNRSDARPLAASASPTPAPGSFSASPRAGASVTAIVVFGTDTVFAEVARSQAERSQGLMYREALPENGGMLFIFPEAAVRSFWMQNTYLPLDIAFMDQDFRILNIEQMEPMTLDSHVSRGPASYALETHQGWFAARGIGPGAVPTVEFRQ